MKKKAIIVSGYFNPIHKGHIEYFNNAKALADELFVIANNNHQINLKGNKEFQKEDERLFILQNNKAVDKTTISIDKDRTVCASGDSLAKTFKNKYHFDFAYGGGQNNNSIPENSVYNYLRVKLIDGLSYKIQSPFWLLKSN